MNWDDYRFFLAVARGRTLKAASRQLGVDQATVGRRIAALQKRLGAQLLQKSSEGFFPTEIGVRTIEKAEAMESALFAIDHAVRGLDNRVEGPVRIAMPGALANDWLIAELGPLLRSYPGLELQLLTGPEVLNLSRREADFALRLVRPLQRDLKASRIGGLTLGLYGTEALAGARAPAALPFVGLFPEARSALETEFLHSLPFEPKYCLRSSAWESVRVALTAGLGIGILPTFMATRYPALRLMGKTSAEAPLWLVLHPELARSARVRVTVEHLRKVLKREP